MMFRVLTTLSASHHGRQVTISSPRHRSILAALVLRANRPVSVDRLITMLWEGEAPATARRQVQNCLGTLRTLFDRSGCALTVRRLPGSYLLSARDDDVDVVVFRNLVRHGRQRAAAGDATAAVRTLQAAVDLWSGVPCAELLCPAFSAEVAALAEERVQALESLASLLLGQGQYERVCLTLCDVQHVYPYHERLASMLAGALHRSGRTGEALAALRQIRYRLRDDLGIDAGPDLLRAELGILGATPAAMAGA